MTPLEQVKAALEYLYNYVADNDPTATWAEAEQKLQEALAALPLIRAAALEEAALRIEADEEDYLMRMYVAAAIRSLKASAEDST